MAPGNHWLLGHLHLLIQVDNFQQAFRLMNNDDGLVGLWAGIHPILSVSDLESARTVLHVALERHPPRLMKRFLYKFVGQHNLVTLNGKAWKFHRGTVARTFTMEFLQEIQQSMRQVAEIMVFSLKSQIRGSTSGTYFQVTDVESLMKMISIDIFGRTALSTDLGSCQRLTSTPLVKAFEFLMQDQMDRVRSPLRLKHFFYCIPTMQNKRQRRERETIRCFVADLLNEKRDIIKEGDRDLLSHLVLAHALEHNNHRLVIRPQDISDEALTDVLMTLLLAGHHTTSATLTFALYLLAKHPEAQDMCLKEINAGTSSTWLEENNGIHYNELVFCTACIWETLRLYPPATRTTRSLDRPVALGKHGFVAPKSTRVHIPIWSIHHNEAIFPRPEEFRPDRWATFVSGTNTNDNTPRWIERPESDASSTSPFSTATTSIPPGNRKAMLAFSAGARSCVGREFAMQEAVIVLATLLKDLKFELVPGFGELITSTRNFLQRPDSPLPLLVSIRR